MSTAAANRLWLRWILERDMPTVLRIEAESFEAPWTEDEFRWFLKQKPCVGRVVEVDGQVAGYMISVLDGLKIRLSNIAVASPYRRMGVGRELVEELKRKIPEQRRTRIVAEVWERNVDAQLFLRACGFRAVQTVRQCFEDGQDAYRFVYRLHAEPAR